MRAPIRRATFNAVNMFVTHNIEEAAFLGDRIRDKSSMHGLVESPAKCRAALKAGVGKNNGRFKHLHPCLCAKRLQRSRQASNDIRNNARSRTDAGRALVTFHGGEGGPNRC